MGARGNSGVIVSQILRGLADAVATTPTATPRRCRWRLRQARRARLRRGRRPARGHDPVGGRGPPRQAAAVTLGERAHAGRGRRRGVSPARRRRSTAPPSSCPRLARAGVVDAGGRGLVVLLDALVEVVTGAASALTPAAAFGPLAPGSANRRARPAATSSASRCSTCSTPATSRSQVCAPTLGELGDSLVVVGTGDGSVERPRPRQRRRRGDRGGRRGGPPAPHHGRALRRPDRARRSRRRRSVGTAVVAVAPGEGLAHLFEGEGVHVVDGGPGDNPSTARCSPRCSATRRRPGGAAAERGAGHPRRRGRCRAGPRGTGSGGRRADPLAGAGAGRRCRARRRRGASTTTSSRWPKLRRPPAGPRSRSPSARR